jgi:hypothetical protein
LAVKEVVNPLKTQEERDRRRRRRRRRRIRKKERKKERKWRGTERHYIFGGRGVRNYISDFEGSQAVPARLSGTGNAYDWI